MIEQKLPYCLLHAKSALTLIPDDSCYDNAEDELDAPGLTAVEQSDHHVHSRLLKVRTAPFRECFGKRIFFISDVH